MAEDIVRILRIIEYTGPRSQVEAQVAKSIHGTRTFGYNHPDRECKITAVTIGDFPEILEKARTQDAESAKDSHPPPE